MRLPLLLALAALAGLAACPAPPPPPADAGEEDAGDAEDSGEPDSGSEEDAGAADAGFGPVAISGWCQTRAFAVCSKDLRCGRLESSKLAACIERSLAGCDQTAYATAVAQGRLQYFAEAGGRCLDGYGNASCWDTAAPANCEGLFQGMVPPDGGCLLAEECQAGGYCQVYLPTCPFKCFSYAPIGASCNWWDRECDEKEASCEQDAGSYSCTPRAGVGMPCPSYSNCRADLACTNGICVKRNAALGEVCNETSGYPYCSQDAFCRKAPSTDGGSAGTCQKRVGLGGVCYGYGSCLPNLRCTSMLQTGTCVALGDEGSTCTGYGECKSELFCWAHSSSCTAHWPDGGDCTSRGSDYGCAPGFFCDFSAPNSAYVCTRKRAMGELCTYDEVCQSSACEFGPLADGGTGSRCIEPCSQRVDGGF